MIVSGVLALVAIGLGIWAFTTKSDLDDANATIDQQNQQRASEEQTAHRTSSACRRSARVSGPPSGA